MTRFPLLDGGIWLPPPLLDRGRDDGSLIERLRDAEGLLCRLVDLGFPVNLSPAGLPLAYTFEPLLFVDHPRGRVKAMRKNGVWLLEDEVDHLPDVVARARWQIALLGEMDVYDWQASVPFSDDSTEVEALAIVLDGQGHLPLPGGHALVQVHKDGPFLLSGPGTGGKVRILTTNWPTEAVRLARSVVGDAWVALPGERQKAIYGSVLPGARLQIKQDGENDHLWHVRADDDEVELVAGGDGCWHVGFRQIKREAGNKPDPLTASWAAWVGMSRRARRLWSLGPDDADLALDRDRGVNAVENKVVDVLTQRGLLCPDCRRSFAVGNGCLNPSCSSRERGQYDEVPVVSIQGSVFIYAPDRPAWVEETGEGKIRGVVGDGLVRQIVPERVVLKRESGRSALTLARLMGMAGRSIPVQASYPLPRPDLEDVRATRKRVEQRGGALEVFDEAFKRLTGEVV